MMGETLLAFFVGLEASMNWQAVLQWAARHAESVPHFVGLVVALAKATTFAARIKAGVELAIELQKVLADFPLPTEQLYKADAFDLRAHLVDSGVGDAAVDLFMEAVEA